MSQNHQVEMSLSINPADTCSDQKPIPLVTKNRDAAMINRENWIMIKEMRSRGCHIQDVADNLGCGAGTVGCSPSS